MDALSGLVEAGFLAMILQNYSDLPLRQALGLLPNSGELMPLMIDALAKLGKQTESAK